MNFNPNVNVVVNPPIVIRRVRDFQRTFVTEQPYVIEDVTRIFNRHILRKTCCVKPECCEFNEFCEQDCCGIPWVNNPCCGPCAGQMPGPCPGQMPGQMPGPGPVQRN